MNVDYSRAGQAGKCVRGERRQPIGRCDIDRFFCGDVPVVGVESGGFVDGSPTGERVLDLDVLPVGHTGHGGVAGRFRQGRFGVVQVAVAVLVGMAAAGTGTHVVERWQRQVAANAEVSLAALVASAGTGGGDGRTVTMEGSLAVANSGPMPVVLEEVTGTAGGLAFRSQGSGTVRPGVKLVLVTVTVECDKGIPAEPVEAVMNVRTADGQARVTSSLMTVQATPWEYTYEQMCP